MPSTVSAERSGCRNRLFTESFSVRHQRGIQESGVRSQESVKVILSRAKNLALR
jgi:hypothetical protein